MIWQVNAMSSSSKGLFFFSLKEGPQLETTTWHVNTTGASPGSLFTPETPPKQRRVGRANYCKPKAASQTNGPLVDPHSHVQRRNPTHMTLVQIPTALSNREYKSNGMQSLCPERPSPLSRQYVILVQSQRKWADALRCQWARYDSATTGAVHDNVGAAVTRYTITGR